MLLNILIVEDSEDDAILLVKELKVAGFDPHWKRVETEADYRTHLGPHLDLIFSDFSLPQFSTPLALTLLQESRLNIPFIIVSGTIGEERAVECLKAGATDYILKDRLARLGPAVRRSLAESRERAERLRTEEELRWQTALQEAQMDSSIDGILVVDSQGKKILQNRRMNELWKIPRYIIEDKDDAAQVVFATNQTKNPQQFIEKVAYLYAHPDEVGHDEIELIDGTILDRYSSPVRDKAGKYYGRIWSFRDITARKQAEREIQRQAAFARFNPNPVLELSATGEIMYFNEATLQMTHTLGQERPAQILPPNTTAIVRDCLATATPLLRLETNSGNRTISWSFFPVALNQVVHCYAGDITERRKLEQQFLQAQKMESIGQLAGGIAHDFNNILTAIIGNLQLVTMEVEGNPALAEYLEEISKATRRATDLVNQILTFSRQGKQERAPIELSHVVLEALKLLRASVPATIEIQTGLAKTPTVLANATAIHQVIMNLGTNAWYAMRNQPGTLKVELGAMEADDDFVKTRPDLHPGRYVRLSVGDTGCGMDRPTLARIFDPFFTTKGVGEGTGLGLAVVHGIMKSHDGGIWVYSQPGEGTTFHLYFPVFESEVVAREIEATTIPRGNGEHILFVDDEAALASLGKKMLERLGYAVTTKTSALEAIAAVRNQPDEFDLVITDLTMPVMDGTKLGSQLLSIQPRLALILATGYSGVMTNEKVRGLGFREVLAKPSTARTLGETVHRVLHPTASA